MGYDRVVSHESGRIGLANREFYRMKRGKIVTNETVWSTSGMILTGES